MIETLLNPAVLFFGLGLAAVLLGSELEIPPSISLALSQVLLLAIGLKGGFAIADNGLPANAFALLAAGLVLSFAIPVMGYAILRRVTRLSPADAAVVAAHYGSVSVVTFMAAVSYLQFRDEAYSGHMVALLVVMEVPAILSGIWLARRYMSLEETQAATANSSGHRALTNAGVLLLLGGLLMGMVSTGSGREQLEAAFLGPFFGLLCLFLLDIGVKAGKHLPILRANGATLPLFGVLMPLVCGGIALLCSVPLGLSVADATLFAVLAASASYIVVPAAMQVALPQANVVVGTAVSLSITFPFNILVGIPLFYLAARTLLGGTP